MRIGQQKRQAEETVNWQDEKWENYSSQEMTEFHRESDNTGNHRHVQFGTRWIQLQRSLETLAGSTMAGWVVGAEARLE